MLLWADGFDHYGTTEANMLDGRYAQAGPSGTGAGLSTAVAATGTHSYYFNHADDVSAIDGLRKVLPSSKTTLGAAGRFYFPNLPEANASSIIFDFLSALATRSQIAVAVDSNGALRFYRGSNYATNGATGTLIATTDPLISTGAFNHIEVQVHIDNTAGWLRVAINGIERYTATDLDTQFDSSGILSVAQHLSFYGLGSIGSHDFYMDDYYIYDFEGDSSVDTDWAPTVDGDGVATNFMGDLGAYLLLPDGDTSEADFAKSTGTTGYTLIDETNPDDTDYIYSVTAGDLSEFTLQDLPPEITYIRGVQVFGRMNKADAGIAKTQLGMKSVAAVEDADERPITTVETYYEDYINVDPNSGARWTRTSLNNSKVRITRSV
jgi:hypothetical protein